MRLKQCSPAHPLPLKVIRMKSTNSDRKWGPYTQNNKCSEYFDTALTWAIESFDRSFAVHKKKHPTSRTSRAIQSSIDWCDDIDILVMLLFLPPLRPPPVWALVGPAYATTSAQIRKSQPFFFKKKSCLLSFQVYTYVDTSGTDLCKLTTPNRILRVKPVAFHPQGSGLPVLRVTCVTCPKGVGFTCLARPPKRPVPGGPTAYNQWS